MAKRVQGSGTSSGREGPGVNTLGLTKATPSRRKKEAPVERQYVGIDLHRRRSVIVRKNAGREVLGKVRIENSPLALAEAVAAAGPEPEVVLEATFGWYWAADVLQEMGARVHLAHPLGNNWGHRRVKNDERDANDLIDLLRLGRLAEAWIAPPEIREAREVVRYRLKLVRLRSGLKAQVHAVMGKHGVWPSRVDMFGLGGNAQLDALELPDGYIGPPRLPAGSPRRLQPGDHRPRPAHRQDAGQSPGLPGDPGDPWRGSDPGRGLRGRDRRRHSLPVPGPSRSWAGMTPTHHESDTKVRRGKITKQGSRHVRWAAVEAVSKNHGDGKIKADYRRISERRGRNIGRVAAARKVLTLVYYGLRDGEIRCLDESRQGMSKLGRSQQTAREAA